MPSIKRVETLHTLPLQVKPEQGAVAGVVDGKWRHCLCQKEADAMACKLRRVCYTAKPCKAGGSKVKGREVR